MFRQATSQCHFTHGGQQASMSQPGGQLPASTGGGGGGGGGGQFGFTQQRSSGQIFPGPHGGQHAQPTPTLPGGQPMPPSLGATGRNPGVTAGARKDSSS